MGLLALALYVMFIWTSLKRVRLVERETYDSRATARIYYLAVGLQAGLVGYMVSSFFASVAYLWYIYYLVGYALCLHRLYDAKGAEGVFSGIRQSGKPNTPKEPIDPPAVSLVEPLTAHRQ
jgi:hypothetical protein